MTEKNLVERAEKKAHFLTDGIYSSRSLARQEVKAALIEYGQAVLEKAKERVGSVYPKALSHSSENALLYRVHDNAVFNCVREINILAQSLKEKENE